MPTKPNSHLQRLRSRIRDLALALNQTQLQQWAYLAVALAAETGLNSGELRDLQWRQIDLGAYCLQSHGEKTARIYIPQPVQELLKTVPERLRSGAVLGPDPSAAVRIADGFVREANGRFGLGFRNGLDSLASAVRRCLQPDPRNGLLKMPTVHPRPSGPPTIPGVPRYPDYAKRGF